jgi:hypothetical protein
MKTQKQKNINQSPSDTLNRSIFMIAEQSEEIEAMQKTLDDQAILRWDLEERNHDLTTRVMLLEAFMEGAKSNQQREAKILQQTESRYADVVKRLEISGKNVQHAKEAAAYQEKTVGLAKIEMDKLRATKVSDEHLARKLIELVEENRKLREDISTKKQQELEVVAIINNQEKYAEQVNRLLNERINYNCQEALTTVDRKVIECGKCLSCQLKQAKNISEQTTKNLQKANDERDSLRESKVKAVQNLNNVITSLDNQRKALIADLTHTKQLNNIMWNGLSQIKQAGLFQRKWIAEETLLNYSAKCSSPKV